jgi:hypothetical protein
VQFNHHHKLSLLLLLLLMLLTLSACGLAKVTDDEVEAAWQTSAHGNLDARSFTRWDEEDPPEIPTNCAKCHSTPGYLDFLGEDGSTIGQVDVPAPIGTTVECEACHNPTAAVKDFTVMPSGLEIGSLGAESNCLECHRGLASSVQVAEMIADHPKDVVSSNLTLPNLHANSVGATFYGTQAKGGAEYPQYEYADRFYHGFDTCATCHDPHNLQVRVDKCGVCHLGATDLEGVRNIRLSRIDYDGDGDISEGLVGEIDTMMEKLWITMQLYAALTDDADLIAFEDGKFLNQNGEAYTTWTPELLQAAYNYHYGAKDPGGYSHNPMYIMQLLYDSIDELGGSTRGMTRPTTD